MFAGLAGPVCRARLPMLLLSLNFRPRTCRGAASTHGSVCVGLVARNVWRAPSVPTPRCRRAFEVVSMGPFLWWLPRFLVFGSVRKRRDGLDSAVLTPMPVSSGRSGHGGPLASSRGDGADEDVEDVAEGGRPAEPPDGALRGPQPPSQSPERQDPRAQVARVRRAGGRERGRRDAADRADSAVRRQKVRVRAPIAGHHRACRDRGQHFQLQFLHA